MNCPTCHAPIPHLALACPFCVARRSLEGMLEMQKSLLPSMLRDEHSFTLSKETKAAAWHVALLACPKQAYCGQEIRTGWSKTYRLYRDMDRIKLCETCRGTLEKLADEVRQEVP